MNRFIVIQSIMCTRFKQCLAATFL